MLHRTKDGVWFLEPETRMPTVILIQESGVVVELPDGREIAVFSDGEIYEVQDGEARKIQGGS